MTWLVCLILLQADPGGYRGLGAESVPREVVARFAPPPVPEDLERKIQSYLDIRSPRGGVLSPGGKRIYFDWNVTGTTQVWRADGPLAFPVQMTGGEDPATVADVTPDGAWVVVSRDRKGEENPGLYLLPADGGPLRVVRHTKGVRVHHQFTSDDSRYLYFTANDREPASETIYRYEIRSGETRAVFTEPGLWEIADRRPGGSWLLHKGLGSKWDEYWEWDPAKGKLLPLLGQGEREEYKAVYGPREGELFVVTARFSEFARAYALSGGNWSPVTPEMDREVEEIRIDRGRRRLLVTVNDGGWLRLLAYDARTRKEIRIAALPEEGHIRPGATTRDGRWTVLGVETDRAPRSTLVLDWAGGRIVPWVRPSIPEIDTSRWAVATRESYPARDGTRIPMLVRRPARCAEDPCPVIVQFHGGPEGRAWPGFSTRAELLVEEGFVLVEPDVRGSEGYGKSWAHADDGPGRLRIITDIEDCARYLRSAWSKDGREPRIGILGGSYGGYSALVGMTMFAGAYDAGVSSVGISNLLTFLRNTAPYRRALRANEYGDPDRDREALVKLSPTTYLDRVKGPILLIQGLSDPRVPAGEAIQMHDALRERGLPVELLLYPDEGHGPGRRENQASQIGHTIRFFREHLLGKD